MFGGGVSGSIGFDIFVCGVHLFDVWWEIAVHFAGSAPADVVRGSVDEEEEVALEVDDVVFDGSG